MLIEQNSGFKRNDSTVNQLLKIVHQIYQDINDGKDTCLVFLDISKAFDKVWHEGLLFKIKRLGITGKLLDWLKDYITDRHQKVVLNVVSSNLRYLTSGVPQGSTLGPLLFLIYVNDITENMECTMNLFADDTSIQQKLTDLTSFSPIKRDLERLSKYGNSWLLKFNATKTEYMIVSKKRSRTNYPNLYLNGANITETEHHTHLGVTNYKQQSFMVNTYKRSNS